MGFRVASGAAVLFGAVIALLGFEPSSALAREMTGQTLLNAPAAAPAVIVDQGLIDGTGDAEPTPTSLDELVQGIATPAEIERQHQCLAGAVYFESKGEPLDGQLAVAQTIMNRAQSGRFPDTACGVVFQRGQFSFVRSGDFPPINRASRAWREAVAIARVAIDESWSSSVDDALFFHASRVSPGWRHDRIAQVGNHVFYR